jgi:predicted DsbA family dithiol-disulfide isomerase
VSADPPVRFVVYSDWLCPWCYLGAARLWRLEAEHPGQVELEWRSYLLRPWPPGEPRDPEKFRAYTRGWERIAAEPDAPEFRAWTGSAAPPSHSLPAQVVSKAAQDLGEAAYRALQKRMFAAYFAESCDISGEAELREVWERAGLPPGSFPPLRDAELVARVHADHERAHEEGATGVPAMRRAEDDFAIVGAQPYELLVRWLRRTRERRASGEA